MGVEGVFIYFYMRNWPLESIFCFLMLLVASFGQCCFVRKQTKIKFEYSNIRMSGTKLPGIHFRWAWSNSASYLFPLGGGGARVGGQAFHRETSSAGVASHTFTV